MCIEGITLYSLQWDVWYSDQLSVTSTITCNEHDEFQTA
jgi:hypothetical protein